MTVSWLLALMLAAIPPERHAPAESAADALTRYEAIAAAVAQVVEAEAPAFGGPKAREKTASLLLAISMHESAWRRDVDDGTKRGDRGGSWCLAQINLGRGGRARTLEGWTGPELVADRAKCFTAALSLARRSINACRRRPPLEWLAAYTSGRCSAGHRESRARMGTAQRWMVLRPPPTQDSMVN